MNQKSHISKNKDFTFLIRVSYLEIYCEEIRDLLGKDQTKRLELKERPDIGVYVKDKKEFAVNSAEDMEKIMTEGNKNRMVASTKMNADSSRYEPRICEEYLMVLCMTELIKITCHIYNHN